MNYFEFFSGIASIISLLLSIFAVSEVKKIKSKITVEGDGNITSGGDMNVRK